MTDTTAPQIKLIVDKGQRLRVHYLGALDINIGVENLSTTATIIIESLALRFQSRTSLGHTRADPHATVVHPAGAHSISPSKLDYFTVMVRPNLLFLRYTNVFDIAVSYRLSDAIGVPCASIGEGWFVLVEPAPQLFGRVFISYKEPEDRALADVAFEWCRDAGFDPYMAPPDIKTGTRMWKEKIPEAISKSAFMLVLWTNNTSRGRGVRREIKIARENAIRLVPLLEKSAADPGLFGRGVEYTRFDAHNAKLALANVVEGQRRM